VIVRVRRSTSCLPITLGSRWPPPVAAETCPIAVEEVEALQALCSSCRGGAVLLGHAGCYMLAQINDCVKTGSLACR
jgi:hypothetical protein